MLTSLTEARRHPALASIDGTFLTNLLTAASNSIEGYCDRVFLSTEYDEVRDGDGLYNIFVKNLPLTTLSSIDIVDSAGTSTNYADTYFDYNGNTGKIRYAPGQDAVQFQDGFQNITIHYIGGYSTIPMDVQQACILTAYNLLRRTYSEETPGMQSETLDMYSYQRMAGVESANLITPDIKLSLDRYRTITI